MSMGRDLVEEYAWEERWMFIDEPDWDPRGPWRIEREAKEGVWTTGDRTQIPVEKMTTSHIRNTIAYLERRNKFSIYDPWIEVFKKELDKRTYKEILDKFEDNFPSVRVDDYGPIRRELFTNDKEGITIWLDNGDVLEYYPKAGEKE